MIRNLKKEPIWDIIIIGGGATGLGCAVDAVTRGYKTLLIEQFDFGKGTSSKSTKLIHGGVRYLAQGNIRLVKEALKERGRLIQNAPHLVNKIEMIIPVYSWWNKIWYYSGLMVYKLLAGPYAIGSTKILSTNNTIKKIRGIKKEGLKGGILFFDGQFDDARLAINLAQTAADHGATVINYVRLTNLIKDNSGIIIGAELKDELMGEFYKVQSKIIINATGVMADETAKMEGKPPSFKLVPSKGVHIVVDKSFLSGNSALMIPKTPDGRVMFAIPWHQHLIIGTTDNPVDEKLFEPKATDEEIELILTTANQYLNQPIKKEDILSIYAGLRPLIAPQNNDKHSKEISRGHEVVYSDGGLISILGGKWTTYRKMAEDGVNMAAFLGNLPKKECKTKSLPVHGSRFNNNFNEAFNVYGSDADEIKGIIDTKPENAELIHPNLPYTKGEVIWCTRHEMAQQIEDILCRRTRSILLNARASSESAPIVADLMMKELEKDETWKNEQLKKFNILVSQYLHD